MNITLNLDKPSDQPGPRLNLAFLTTPAPSQGTVREVIFDISSFEYVKIISYSSICLRLWLSTNFFQNIQISNQPWVIIDWDRG